jgi:YD repeat-containing protein
MDSLTSYTDPMLPGKTWTVITTDPSGLQSGVRVDSIGQVVAQIGPAGSGSSDSAFPSTLTVTGYQYNDESAVIAMTQTSTISDAMSVAEPKAKALYPFLSRQIQKSSATGSVLSVEHSSDGGPCPLFVEMQSATYDTVGRPKSQKSIDVVTDMAYDDTLSGTGKLSYSKSTGSAPTYRKFDSIGNQIKVSDEENFNGPNTIQWGYDALSRVLVEGINITGKTTREWVYAGNTTTYTNRNNWVTTTTVDISGRKTTEVAKQGAAPYSTTESTIYSTGAIKSAKNTDNQPSATVTSLSNYQYTYDALGQVTNQHISLGTLPGKSFDLAYTNGSLASTSKTDTRTIQQNGTPLLTTTTVYDHLRRIDKIFEAPAANSNLSPKAVDFTFSGAFLTELKRFNASNVDGTPVSNSTFEYEPNRKIGMIYNYAVGVSVNANAQAIHYDDYGRLKQVVNTDGGGPSGTRTYLRNDTGSIAQVKNAANAVIQNYVYNESGEMAASDEPYGRVLQDGNNRYKYDDEGNVVQQWRFKTQDVNSLSISKANEHHDTRSGLLRYDSFVSIANPEATQLYGWHQLQLMPIRIASTQVLSSARVTVHLYRNDSIGWDTRLVDETFDVQLVKDADGSYVIPRTYTWDRYIPQTTDKFYMDFRVDILTPHSIHATFKVDGKLSLARYDVYSEYKFDNRNRMVEAKQWTIGKDDSTKITPTILLNTESYKYDAVGNRIHTLFKNGSDQVEDDRTYLYENGKPLLEFNGDDKLERERLYAASLDQLLAVEDFDFDGSGNPEPSETIWTLTDYQGSVNSLYVSASRFTRLHYDDFGRPVEPRETVEDNQLRNTVSVGYLGLEFDDVTSLYLDAGRAYDPVGGRYLTASGLGNGVQGIYAFANNTPADRTTNKVAKDFNSTSSSAWETFASEFTQEADVSSQWQRGNYFKAGLYGTGQLMAAVGIAGLGAIGGGLALGGTTASYALATGGAVAGTSSSMIGTALNSNGNAGFSEYMLSGGFGGAMGGLNAVGSIAELGIGLIGAGIGAQYGNASLGFQIGGMAGGIAGGGIDDFGRAIGKGALHWGAIGHAARRVGVEGGFTLGGGAVGYAATGTMDGALMGASMGQAIGGAFGNFAVACFTAGTPLVVDLEGNSRPIDEIEVGDFVLARSEFDPNGPLELKRVEEKFVRTAVVMELVVHGQSIKTTAEHPFFVPAQGKFVAAGELQVGEQLLGHDGKLVQIESIGSTGEVTTVYNLRVADFHTYFVGGGLWGFDVWVHNASYVPDAADVAKYSTARQSGMRVNWTSINPELTGSQRSAVRSVARSQGIFIPTPNGHGAPGNASHQKTVAMLLAEAREEFPTNRFPGAQFLEGRSIRPYTGVNRNPDVSVIYQGSVLKVYEAARQRNGNWVPRELAKQQDYINASIASRFLKVT